MQGKLRLVGTEATEGHDKGEVLRLAAAVEGSTRHPLADAVLLAAQQADLQARLSLHLSSPCMLGLPGDCCLRLDLAGA